MVNEMMNCQNKAWRYKRNNVWNAVDCEMVLWFLFWWKHGIIAILLFKILMVSYWYSLEGTQLSLEHVQLEQTWRCKSVSALNVVKEGKEALGMTWVFLIRQLSEVSPVRKGWRSGEKANFPFQFLTLMWYKTNI